MSDNLLTMQSLTDNWSCLAGRGLAMLGWTRSGHAWLDEVWSCLAGRGLVMPGWTRSGHAWLG